MTDEQELPDELEKRLLAYASARLSPRTATIKAMRASLVQDARMASLAESLSPQARARRWRHRVAAGLIAASLAVGGVAGVAAASSPGGPLYGTRIWLEYAKLPADPGARALERLHMIDSRVLDLEAATRAGDSSAVAAAATAYRDAIQASISEAGANGDQLDNLESALQLHVGILETIAGRAPGQAQSGLSRAIQASTKAVDEIRASRPARGTPTGDPPGAGKSPGSGSNSDGLNGASPSHAPPG